MISERQIEFLSSGTKLRGRVAAASEGELLRPDRLVICAPGDGPKGTAGRTWISLASALTARSVAILLFDYAGTGNSDGDPAGLGIDTALLNLQDAAAYAREQFPAAKIGLMGASLGGTAVLLAVQRGTRCEAICLKSPAVRLQVAYDNEYGPNGLKEWKKTNRSPSRGLDYRVYKEAQKAEVLSKAGHIKVPTLIVHGTADSIAPIHDSRRLAAKIGECATLIELDGADHDYGRPGDLDRLVNEHAQFFAERMT